MKIALFLVTVFSVYASTSQALELKEENFQPISFPGIQPTNYEFADSTLTAKADKSASALIHPFEKVVTLKSIHFEWQSDGKLQIDSKEYEASKAGDDARLRIGLMLKGKAPLIPFFAPSWIKKTREIMKLESDKMLYLIAGAKHPSNSRWKSPYSDSITNISLPSSADSRLGWQKVDYMFEQNLEVVGLWIMVDSDDTNSSIKTSIRNLKLKTS